MTGTLAVVIPTRDRPSMRDALLDDLAGQSLLPTEVLVVDDSKAPTDLPARMRSRSVHVIRPGSRVFISRARNLGWSACRADFVAFVDDDNRLPVHLLRTLVQDLDEHPTWGAVMPGAVYRSRPDLVWVYATPFAPDRWSFDLVGRNAVRNPTMESSVMPTDALPNLSVVRRAVLESVGGFDERFPVSSTADLCQRIKQAGWEVWADPRVLTEHDVEPPGIPGYWAEHALGDAERFRLDVADWFRFQRRWNNDRRLFAARAGLHAVGFLASHFVALSARAPRRVMTHAVAAVSGIRDGLTSTLG